MPRQTKAATVKKDKSIKKKASTATQNNDALANSLANIGLQLVELAKGLSGGSVSPKIDTSGSNTGSDNEMSTDLPDEKLLTITEKFVEVKTKGGQTKKVRFINPGGKENTKIRKDRNPRPRITFDPANTLGDSSGIKYHDGKPNRGR